MAITIHPELHSLIPPLTTEEYTQLEANIRADGCHDPLMVWQEEQTLLDGHHRYEICERHGLRYTTQEVGLADLDAAKAWMIANQLGRRNLTLDQTRYYRGKQYELHKKVKRGGGDRKSTEARHQKPHNEAFDNTAHELAVQHKVSKATIERDAVYAKAIDTLADVAGPEVRHALLGRETKVTQHEVKALAKMAKQHPHTVKQALDAVQEVKTPKQARQIVREKAREAREHDAWMDRMIRSELGEEAVGRPAPPAVQQRAWTLVYIEGLGRRLTKALESLDRLHAHLAGDQDGLVVQLPALLEHQAALCIRLGQFWGHVEKYLLRSEAVRTALGDPPPVPEDPAPQPETETPAAKEALPVAAYLMVERLQPCTNAQVAKALGKQRNLTHQALQSLVKQGKLAKEGLTYRVIQPPSPRETPAPQGPSKPRKPGSLRKAVA